MAYTFRARDLNVTSAVSGNCVVEVPIQVLDEKGAIVHTETVSVTLTSPLNQPAALKTEFISAIQNAAKGVIQAYLLRTKLKDGLLSVLLNTPQGVSADG